MQIPLQVMFENAEPSVAVRAAIGHEVERLEKYQHHITGCRVAVVAPSRKHRHGAVYRINIWVTIPPQGNIVVSHQPSGDRGHVHVEVAIKDAFAAARRQIEALAQRASGRSSSTRSTLMGEFRRFLQKKTTDFIATLDEGEIYFHRDIVIDKAFDRLNVGSEVRFAEEFGEKGVQASTVQPMGEHHLSEQNHRR